MALPESSPSRTNPPAVRDCPDCHRPSAMKLRSLGVFTSFYICEHCGVTLTIPPPPLAFPGKDFQP